MAKLMINYGDHKGRVRARTTVEYIDGSRGRLEAYVGSKREAKINMEEKIEERNKEIRYGKQKRAGDISLADAVKDKIKERREAYDRNKGRERLRDSSAERDDEVFHSLLLPHKISKKKLNQIFVPDVEEYRTWLDRAQYDKCQIKDPARHVPKMTYYSASTLNRIVRLVVAAIDEYYMNSEYKSPAIALKPFQVTTKEKTDEDFLVDDEIYKVLEVFKQMRNSPRYPLDATYADIFTLALLTALRPGELRGLKKRDWNSKTYEIAIMRTGEYEDGRTKTERSRKLNSE